MELKSTKTEKNLIAAFSGESMARNRYTFYADKAKKEGYEKVAEVFELTAENERAHAKEIFRLLHATESTAINLENAAYGEHEEWSEIYREAAKAAFEEGFQQIGEFFKNLQAIEKSHEERFKALQKQVEDGTMFKDLPTTKWICKNCGYEHTGSQPPMVCPVCKHSQGYYERKQGQ